MGYDVLKKRIEELENLSTRIGFSFHKKSPVALQLSLVKESIDDYEASLQDAAKKWTTPDRFLDWYRAQIAINSLCETVLELQNQPDDKLKKLLELATRHSISQDFQESQSKQYFFELQVAAWLHRSGFRVTLEEPDLRIAGNGLSQELGVACKYPSSEAKLNENISKGYRQITGQGLKGVVAIGLDLLVCQGMKNFVVFPEDERVIVPSMSHALKVKVDEIIRSRAGTAGRTPLDGAFFSLNMYGIRSKHPSLIGATQFTLQVDFANPLSRDVGVIVQKLNSRMAEPSRLAWIDPSFVQQGSIWVPNQRLVLPGQ